jgi:hypothetical protein
VKLKWVYTLSLSLSTLSPPHLNTEFSKAQHSFATALSNFKFESIGGETEAEKMIMNSLQTFAQLLLTIEDYRHSMLSTISVRLLQNLERFRKEHIQSTKEEKKQFDRSSEKYYQSLEKKLGMSNKKKESALNEHDQHLEIEHAGFRQASFNYVCKLQQVHAMKQYELIEPIIGYISDVSTFLHQAYDNICALKPELRAVQFKVQILRETQLEEQQKQYELKAQVIEEGESGLVHHPEFLKQGLLFVQDVAKKGGRSQVLLPSLTFLPHSLSSWAGTDLASLLLSVPQGRERRTRKDTTNEVHTSRPSRLPAFH